MIFVALGLTAVVCFLLSFALVAGTLKLLARVKGRHAG